MYFSSLFVLASACLAAAEEFVITVGGNTTGNGTTTFEPRFVVAALGDVVTFNFTNGNHTATQSTFDSPCIPAHETNVSINGFDSGFRYTEPGTAGTILSVPIIEQNVNQTFWFYDYNTCGEGGVGVINGNESSSQTLAGFTRNAIRLNGTNTSDTTSTTSTTSYRLSPTAAASTIPQKSTANRVFSVGVVGAIPLFVATLFL